MLFQEGKHRQNPGRKHWLLCRCECVYLCESHIASVDSSSLCVFVCAWVCMCVCLSQLKGLWHLHDETLKLFPETKSNGFLTGVVLATAGYDGSQSDTAPRKSDSIDEHRLKVSVETWGVNWFVLEQNQSFCRLGFPSKLTLSKQTV